MSDIEIIKTIVTEFPYALLGSLTAGLLCAYLGVYVVSKRVVFVGATLTQVAVAGIAFSHLPFIHIDPVWGSVIFTLATTVLFAQLLRSRLVPRDSVLGASYVIAIAVRILMIQKSPAAEVSEIDAILKGDILFVTSDQFYLLFGVFLAVMAIHLLFYKAFIFVSFDAETASTQGFRSQWWELFFYLTVGIAVSIATRIVGDVFVFGFLVIPAVTAILIARKVKNIFFLALVFGVLSPILGLYLAFKLDFPAGPTTVATAFIILTFSWVVSKFR
ncbi:MAG: metal ABC transporter permease [Ignavibacteriales bacterium]|nr:metal ABC transporter permease [Ignavibacteriales bacterium]